MSGLAGQETQRPRALYLGSAGTLALVRCGLCGRRNCFDRRRWWWFQVAFCRRCWQAVLYDGLVMVSRWEGERLLMENTAFGGELRALREVEREARRFLAYYDLQPWWEWRPQVRGIASDMTRTVALAKSVRARRRGDHDEVSTPALPPAAAAEEGDGRA